MGQAFISQAVYSSVIFVKTTRGKLMGNWGYVTIKLSMKVFIFDPVWPKLVDERLEKQLSVLDVQVISDVKPLADAKELFEGDEERILCINPDYVGWKLAGADYRDIPNLKAILTESTSFDWIESDIANERNIPICNITNFSTEAVAEWAITAMLNLARQLPQLIKDEFPLDFDADFMKYRGIQVKGKTAGIIGLGHNGAAIAERCKGLGMNVIYWSRTSSNNAYERVELDELLQSADVIFPAFAKNNETEQLLSEEYLLKIKPSAIVVDIIDLDSVKQLLLDMVAEGRLFGYGFEAKPASFGEYQGNVWAAPAYAWATYESMYDSLEKLVENIMTASKGKFPNRVN